MFFDFKKVPNIKAALRAEVDPKEFTLKLTSEPFQVRGYKRIAVKALRAVSNPSALFRYASWSCFTAHCWISSPGDAAAKYRSAASVRASRARCSLARSSPASVRFNRRSKRGRLSP